MELLENKIIFYDKESGNIIGLISQLQNLFYTQNNKVYFIQNEDNEFYAPQKNKIDSDSDFIILSQEEIGIDPNSLQNFFIQHIEDITIFVYHIDFSKDICNRLRIEIALPPPMKLIGGLKSQNGCYYNFSLPILEFKQSQKSMFINSEQIEINSNRVVLSLLPCIESLSQEGGSVVLSLPDFLPLKFRIEKLEEDCSKKPDYLGWELTEMGFIPVSKNKPADTIDKKIISGFCSNFEFKNISKPTHKSKAIRTFIEKNNFLENRFSKKRVNRGFI